MKVERTIRKREKNVQNKIFQNNSIKPNDSIELLQVHVLSILAITQRFNVRTSARFFVSKQSHLNIGSNGTLARAPL
jgi:hypothetical protein